MNAAQAHAVIVKALPRCLLLALVTLSASGSCASAKSHPARPAAFVVPFAAGGGTEFLARLLGQRLEQRLGKPFVVQPEIKDHLFRMGLLPIDTPSVANLKIFVQAEIARWSRVVEQAGIAGSQ